VIRGVHALFYTTQPDAARAFLRDKLGLDSYDSGGGWLMFNLVEGDVACHPSDRAFHNISFYCDDLESTMSELRDRDVELTPVVEEEWGSTTTFELPGGGPVLIYQPKYAKTKL
jgi:hypothetical protein